jgi:2-dehydropantoate 2-reductase
MRYAVVGAGAIGGTVGARLARGGHEVLLCDTDAEHVAAINRDGLSIEGPVEQFRVWLPAVTPEGLPPRLGVVLLAVKAHHTAEAMEEIEPRLAADGFVVSLQNGLNEGLIAEAVGADRVVGAFVNFGADVVAPGRNLVGNRATFRIGELDGHVSAREEALADEIDDAEATAYVLGSLWS